MAVRQNDKGAVLGMSHRAQPPVQPQHILEGLYLPDAWAIFVEPPECFAGQNDSTLCLIQPKFLISAILKM